MISEVRAQATECFVYIMMPGDTELVPAGRFELTTDRHGIATGRFVYGKSYLARGNAVPIDPLDLKLTDRVAETRQLKGVFGALRDASPDYWGRRIIEKFSGLSQLGELDYFLHSPDDRAGALGFGLSVSPPAPKREFNRTLDLEKRQTLADSIIADEETPQGPEGGRRHRRSDGKAGSRPMVLRRQGRRRQRRGLYEDLNGICIPGLPNGAASVDASSASRQRRPRAAARQATFSTASGYSTVTLFARLRG